MNKQKIVRTLKNHIQIVGLFLLIVITILATNLYSFHKKNQINSLKKTLDNIYLKKSIITIIQSLKPRYQIINLKVESGETLEKILNKIDVTEYEKNKLLQKLSKFKFTNKLYKNQKISFKIDKKDPVKILEFSIKTSKKKTKVFTRDIKSDVYKYKEIDIHLKKVLEYKEAEITSSLYASAIKMDIEPNIIVDFARIYGFQIDFQRDIWKNDSFQIVYETFLNEDNKTIETGKIIFANLILQGRENPLYIFKLKERYDHFDKFGKSIKKSLMKTPINGARLSSSFGMRKHPILGFNKMHRGTDFAAPMGTPIMASGDGVVKKAGWCGGGGNCVVIKHNSTYQTVYAHMSKFANGIRSGKRVKQGQIIGYVG